MLKSSSEFNIEHLLNNVEHSSTANNVLLCDTHVQKCSCTKTKCVKMYCQCYALNKPCVDCNCKDCLNKPSLYGDHSNKTYVKGGNCCTCTKTNCNKKYCECFKKGMKCSDECRCVNCRNRWVMCEEFQETGFYVQIMDNVISVNDMQVWKRMLVGNKRRRNFDI